MKKGDQNKKKLTLAQEKFCILYAQTFNQTEAILQAFPKYKSRQTACQYGYELMNKPEFLHVREHLDLLVNAHLNELKVSRESILKELAEMGFCELPKVKLKGDSITVTGVSETLAQELEFQSGKAGDKVKWKGPDKVKALVALDDILRKHNQSDDDDGDNLIVVRVGK